MSTRWAKIKILPERARMLVQTKVSMQVETVVLLSRKAVKGYINVEIRTEELKDSKVGYATYSEIKAYIRSIMGLVFQKSINIHQLVIPY